MVPQNISTYKILEKLGAGGMGEVYLALDTKLERKVALKLLPQHLTSDESRLRRFIQEARAASALNHPNILTVHEIGEAEGIHFIATEFIEGETLRERMGGPMAVRNALEIAIQVASALAAAHQALIVHRDVKPENIILRPDGYVKLLDFGLAKPTETSRATSRTQAPTVQLNTEPGMLMGTVNYMSPEQVRGLAVDIRSDVFSFGVLLYEMVSGRLPFAGNSTTDTLISIVQNAPAPLASLISGAPIELDRIVRRCLEKEREQRYQSASDVLTDLKRLAAGHSLETIAMKPSPAVAVLPFVNMSADPENEYFCDGLAEELLNALAKIKGLRVAARTSSFTFKGRNSDIREIGQQLNVSTVLEGSVRKSGSKLRITAQLVNAADGYHLWSDRYDRQMDDVFEIQDEITLAIVEALKVTLLGEEKEKLLNRGPRIAEAQDLYLKGLYHFNKYNDEGFAKAIEFFERAIETDPGHAAAHADLANTYGTMCFLGNFSPREFMPRVGALMKKSLELDDGLAKAHLIRANYGFYFEYDIPAAAEAYRRAIALDPNSAEVRVYYAHFLLKTGGGADEAVRQSERALQLDPLSLNTNVRHGTLLVMTGRPDEALLQARRVLELEPRFYGANWLMASAKATKGLYEEAAGECEKALTLGVGSQTLALFAHILGKLGQRERALELIAGLEREAEGGAPRGYQLAIAYAGLDDAEKAMSSLEKAYEERNLALTSLSVEPTLAEIRSDPRCQELLKRIGLVA